MYRQWCAMRDRVSGMRSKLAARYPGKYFLVCVHTGRFAVGCPDDGQGGHKHASQVFDCKHGTMSQEGVTHRDFLGITLSVKTKT